MIRHDVVENIFDMIDEMSLILAKELQIGYLEAMCDACENIVNAEIMQKVDEHLHVKLFEMCKKISEIEPQSEEVRKALQLAILKGLKSENLSLDTMTPDSIAMIIGYLGEKLILDLEMAAVADLTVGAGNLLTAVLNTFKKMPSSIYGADTDFGLIKIAKAMADMQDYEVQFFNQSSAQPLLMEPVDLIISDLPTSGIAGREDLDLDLVRAGCKYLPYLLIENHLCYLKPGGYAIYVVPNDLFSQSFSKEFHQIVSESAYIQMLLQLPESLFKDASLGKSLFVIRKKKTGLNAPSEALVVQLPPLNDPLKFSNTLTKVDDWIKINR